MASDAQAASAQSAPTVKFAIGTFVVLKLTEIAANVVKSQAKQHVHTLASKHKHLLTKKRVIVGGVVLAGLAAYLYYRYKKAQLLAAQTAAADAAKKQDLSPEEVIAAAIPPFDVSIW